jgi:hypothetical protein
MRLWGRTRELGIRIKLGLSDWRLGEAELGRQIGKQRLTGSKVIW